MDTSMTPCRTCQRPFSPTHDADAPGPTTRHPYVVVAPPGAVSLDLGEIEAHRPVQRPYPGAPGFVLTHCPTCDGRRERVQLASDEPATCAVWRDAQGVQPTSSPR